MVGTHNGRSLAERISEQNRTESTTADFEFVSHQQSQKGTAPTRCWAQEARRPSRGLPHIPDPGDDLPRPLGGRPTVVTMADDGEGSLPQGDGV